MNAQSLIHKSPIQKLLTKKSKIQEILQLPACIQNVCDAVSAKWKHFQFNDYFIQPFLAYHEDNKHVITTHVSVIDTKERPRYHIEEIINFQLANSNTVLSRSHNVRHEL